MSAGHTRRGPGRPPGIKNTEAQNEAAKANLAKAHRASKERGAARRASKKLEKPRWKKLEDGDISVRDLTDKELVRRECANNDGTWEGRRHQLPPRLISRMDAESVRRARNGIDRLTKPALRALRTRLEDDEAPAQQLAAAKMVLEYKVGKVPEVIHVGAETEYDRLQQTGFVIMRGIENVSVETDDDDIVDAEVVEDDEEAAR